MQATMIGDKVVAINNPSSPRIASENKITDEKHAKVNKCDVLEGPTSRTEYPTIHVAVPNA